MDSEEIAKQLDEHPELKERVIQLLSVVNNKNGEVTRADEAERRVIEELRQTGRDALQAWGNRQTKAIAQRVQKGKPWLRKHEKKPLLVECLRKNRRRRTDILSAQSRDMEAILVAS